jgi:antitoxin HicB
MTATETRDVQAEVERYMALPYRIEMIPDPEAGGYVVRVPDLPGCLSQGDSPDEAIAMIRDAMRGWLTVALEHGDAIPQPRPASAEEYSGKFNVRVPKRLHRALVEAAEADGVSLNLFVSSALAAAVGERTGPADRSRRPRTGRSDA